MDNLVDPDQGGSNHQTVRTYLGPTIGWVDLPVMPELEVTSAAALVLTPYTSRVLLKAAVKSITLPSVKAWMLAQAQNNQSAFDRSIWIKDLAYSASVGGAIVITPFTGDKIDGLTSYKIIQPGSIMRLNPLTDLSGWFVAVADVGITGGILPPPPLGWIDRVVAGSRKWSAIATSGNGTKLAAGDQTPGLIYTSSDSGVSWISHPAQGSHQWFGMGFSTNGQVIAACYADPATAVIVSTDAGLTWNDRSPPATFGSSSLGISGDGSKLIVTGSSIWISVDGGSTWTSSAPGGRNSWLQCGVSRDGSTFVASDLDTGVILKSTNNGSSWIDITPVAGGTWVGFHISSNGLALAATADTNGDLWTSTNGGTSWTHQAATAGFNASSLLTGSDSGVILLADSAIVGDVLQRSTDGGVTWAAQNPPGDFAWNTACSSSDGLSMAAAIFSGDIWTGTFT